MKRKSNFNRPSSFKEKTSLERSQIGSYALVTVAYNEEHQIEHAIRCILEQSIRPKQWLIVSDGSTDRTDTIIKHFTSKYPWIKYARLEKILDPHKKYQAASFAYARSMALALKKFKHLNVDFIANLDADITFEGDYFESVLKKAIVDEDLGITGGGAYSVLENGTVIEDGFIQPDFVGGPVQFFRKQCLQDINGYFPYGHADVVAVFMARMKGWKVQCFPVIRAYHHGQPKNSIRAKVPICFRLGQIDYIMEGNPLFICGRCILRMFKKPIFLAGLSMLAGYCWAAIRKIKRHLPRDVVEYMKADQKQKMKKYFGLSRENFRLK